MFTFPVCNFGKSGVDPSLEFINTYTSISDLASYNFSVSFGNNPSPTRLIIACVTIRKTASITSATIGGVSATINLQATRSSNDYCHGIISAIVPTGTSGNIVINIADAGMSAAISVYAADGLKSVTPTLTRSTTSTSTSISVAKGGIAIATAGNYKSGSVICSWSGTVGVVENSDVQVESVMLHSCASTLAVGDITNGTIVASPSSSGNFGLLAVVWE